MHTHKIGNMYACEFAEQIKSTKKQFGKEKTKTVQMPMKSIKTQTINFVTK